MNERETAQHPDEAERRLLPLDLGALALVALTLFLAPLMAGGFVSPNSTEILSTSETIGLPLVLILTAMATLLVVAREYKNPVALGTLLGVRESAVLLGIWGAVTLLFSPVRFVCWGSLFTLWAVLMIAGLTARLGRSARDDRCAG